MYANLVYDTQRDFYFEFLLTITRGGVMLRPIGGYGVQKEVDRDD
jgi:hypothetical protein